MWIWWMLVNCQHSVFKFWFFSVHAWKSRLWVWATSPNCGWKDTYLIQRTAYFFDKLLKKDCASNGGRYEIYLSSSQGHASVLILLLAIFFYCNEFINHYNQLDCRCCVLYGEWCSLLLHAIKSSIQVDQTKFTNGNCKRSIQQ